MIQQPRPRRRILDQSNELSLDPLEAITSEQPTPVTGRRRRTRDQSHDHLSEPSLDTEPLQVDPTPTPDRSEIAASSISSDYLNHIRTELLEDLYHDDLAESSYSDDSHDWGWDSQSLSDHYWHFLGRYE